MLDGSAPHRIPMNTQYSLLRMHCVATLTQPHKLTTGMCTLAHVHERTNRRTRWRLPRSKTRFVLELYIKKHTHTHTHTSIINNPRKGVHTVVVWGGLLPSPPPAHGAVPWVSNVVSVVEGRGEKGGLLMRLTTRVPFQCPARRPLAHTPQTHTPRVVICNSSLVSRRSCPKRPTACSRLLNVHGECTARQRPPSRRGHVWCILRWTRAPNAGNDRRFAPHSGCYEQQKTC